jgi:hypothetical protein
VSNVIGFVGAVLLANAGWMVVQRLSASSVTTGRVVDYEKTTGSSPSVEASSEPTTLYSPVIEFTDHNKQRHRFTAVGGDPQPRPRRGTQMRVRYRAANPETAYVATFSRTWVMPIVWAVGGAVLLYVEWG